MNSNNELDFSSTLSTRIVDEFSKRVTGSESKDFYTYQEISEIMVGILDPGKDVIDDADDSGQIESEEKFRNITSIGMNFTILESAGPVRIVPNGHFFYRVQNDYDEELSNYLSTISQLVG